MQISEVKKYLYNNPEKIVDLLEDAGCHHIRHYNGKRVQGARPEGDNPTSVQVLLSDTILTSVIHTDPDFEGGDIFYLIAHLKGIDNGEAIRYVFSELGFNVDYKPKEYTALDFVDDFVRFDIRYDRYNKVENKTLPKVLYDQFIDAPHRQFTEEGISLETQQKFNICYDQLNSRIIIPIYDTKGQIITFKGRAISDDIFPKYVAYYSFNGLNVIYGYHQNLFDIYRKGEVIVFESEKSVLKADSCGIHNTLALMRHKVSKEQIEMLIKLQVDIVWAMDEDIPAREVIYNLDKFGDMVNIEVIHDFNNRLDEKNSPIDQGLNIFKELYNERVSLKELRKMLDNEDNEKVT